VKVIDIGTQQGEYEGKINHRRQVIIGWELPNELMTDGEYAGKPFAVNKWYTQSLGEKANLRKDLTNWRGKEFTAEELAGFDAKNIIGKPCMLSLTENEKKKVRVTGVMALPKGMTVPLQVNPTIYLSLEEGEYDASVYNALSDKMRAMIALSPEWHDQQKPRGHFDTMPDSPVDEDDDESIPF